MSRVLKVDLLPRDGRQVNYLGKFTSFPSLLLEFADQCLAAMHQPNNASRLEKQEHDDQKSINESIQVAACQSTRGAAGGQQREIIDYLGQPKDKSCSQQRSPDTGDAADKDSSNELDGERQIPVIGSDIAGVRGEKSARYSCQE